MGKSSSTKLLIATFVGLGVLGTIAVYPEAQRQHEAKAGLKTGRYQKMACNAEPVSSSPDLHRCYPGADLNAAQKDPAMMVGAVRPLQSADGPRIYRVVARL